MSEDIEIAWINDAHFIEDGNYNTREEAITAMQNVFKEYSQLIEDDECGELTLNMTYKGQDDHVHIERAVMRLNAGKFIVVADGMSVPCANADSASHLYRKLSESIWVGIVDEGNELSFSSLGGVLRIDTKNTNESIAEDN